MSAVLALTDRVTIRLATLVTFYEVAAASAILAGDPFNAHARTFLRKALEHFYASLDVA